jgi:3-oxoadipate CoA-transferase alpha subunit
MDGRVINKEVENVVAAVADIKDGSTILVGGFGAVGQSEPLLSALIEQGAKELTIVANNSGLQQSGLARLVGTGNVRKLICSFPRGPNPGDSDHFLRVFNAGKLAVELVPQGTLSERMRAGAAGIGGFYVKVGLGTELAEGKEVHEINGVPYVLEKPIKGDYAICQADRADRWGNLTYRKAARNFNPTMAAAADVTIVGVREMVELGTLDPEHIVTPGIFVDRVVVTGGAS